MITLFANSESPIDSFKNTAYRRGYILIRVGRIVQVIVLILYPDY